MQAADHVSAWWRAGLLVAAGLVPSACADTAGVARVGHTTYSVERLGHGTYSVRTHIIGIMTDADDAKADNVRAATGYCAKKSLPMTIIGDKGYSGCAPQDTLTFRCGAPAANKPQGEAPAGST